MRILIISPRLPHSRVRSGHAIVHQRVRRLANRGHEIGVACYVTADDRPYLDEVREGLVALETLPLPPPRPWPLRLLHEWLGWPAPFNRFPVRSMARLVGEMIERDQYEVALAEFSEMGLCFWRNPWLPAVRAVISCHQCATIASEKRCELLGYGWAGLRERWRRDRLLRREFALYRSADHVLALTPQERWQMLNYAPDLRLSVVPYGVDVDVYRPPADGVEREGVVFTGFYQDEPNRDAVHWFLDHVWPGVVKRVPTAVFYIVGPNPTERMRAEAEKDARVIVTGEVPDVREYLTRAAVFVCPVRMGSGMRGKILEAMACGMAVVTTTLGAEGIPAVPGENCLLADDPGLMIEHVAWLLRDKPFRHRLGSNARTMVEEKLSWEKTVQKLEEILLALVR